jgi:MFS family permease
MQRNILLSYLLSTLRYSWFWLGIWMLYYLRFTNYAGVGLIETMMIVTTVGLEIPTGAIADLLGKKITLVIGFVLIALGNVYMGLTPDFNGLLISVFVMVSGYTLISGTLEALTYDTLLELKQKERFDQVLANQKTFQLVGTTTCSIIGGFMYLIFPGLPFLAVAAAGILGAIVCLFLKEPHIDTEKFSFSNYVKQTKAGFQELFGNRTIIALTLFLLTLTFLYVPLHEGLEDMILVEYGFSAQQLGIILAVLNLVLAIISQLVPRFKKHFNSLNIVFAVGVLCSFTLIVNPLTVWFLAPLLSIARMSFVVISDIITSDTLNAKLSSQNRATSLSTFEMIKKLPYVLFALPMGMLADNTSARFIGLAMGIVFLLFCLLSLVTTYPKLSQSRLV